MSVSDQLAFPQDLVPGFERLAIDVLVSLVNQATEERQKDNASRRDYMTSEPQIT